MKFHKSTGCTVTLQPGGRQIRVPNGSNLRKAVFKRDAEMPCGGHGECRGCRVRMVAGQTAPSDLELGRLKPDEIDQGWRLACQTRVDADMTLEMRPWMESCILPDRTPSLARHAANLTLAFLAVNVIGRIFTKRSKR